MKPLQGDGFGGFKPDKPPKSTKFIRARITRPGFIEYRKIRKTWIGAEVITHAGKFEGTPLEFMQHVEQNHDGIEIHWEV